MYQRINIKVCLLYEPASYMLIIFISEEQGLSDEDVKALPNKA